MCSFLVAHAGIFEYWSVYPRGRDRERRTEYLYIPVNHGNGTYSASFELNITGVSWASMLVNHTYVSSNYTAEITVRGIAPDLGNTRLEVWNTRYGGRAMQPLPVYVRSPCLGFPVHPLRATAFDGPFTTTRDSPMRMACRQCWRGAWTRSSGLLV